MSVIEIKNKRVTYFKEGKGETCFVLIHGWGGGTGSLQNLHDRLKGVYTSLIFDLPGFGNSDNPDTDWGINEYGDFIADFIRELGLKKVILFGHSFGGALSIYLAAKCPNLVEKLILCAPSFKRNNSFEQEKKKGFWDAIKGFTKLPFYERLKPKIKPIRKIFYKIFFPNSEALVHSHLESNFRKIVTQDITPMLGEIRQKILILWGDEDTFVPLEHAYILKTQIKDSKLQIYEGIGHGLPKFKPEWVYTEVKKFIEGN